MSLTQRAIDITITLGDGLFGEQVGATYLITGLRVFAYISTYGGETQGICNARIFGLPLDLANKITTIGPQGFNIPNQNRIEIAAGDANTALPTIYKGWIQESHGNFQSAPETAVELMATSVAGPALKPEKPASYRGSMKVADVMQQLAGQMGFSFENNGVTTVLGDYYLAGSTLDKVKDVARAANINYSTDNGVLAIWNKGSSRPNVIPIIAPSTTMVGYPSFSSSGVIVRSLFLPHLTQGQQFTIQGSQVSQANRTWIARSIVHSLQSQTPNGEWFSDIEGYPNYVS